MKTSEKADTSSKHKTTIADVNAVKHEATTAEANAKVEGDNSSPITEDLFNIPKDTENTCLRSPFRPQC